MRSIKILFCFCVLLVVSCSKRQEHVIFVGPEEALELTDTIKMASVRSESPLLDVGRMFIAENRLVVYQPHAVKLFQIYALPLSGKCFSAGMTGRGGNEFIDPDLRSIIGCQDGFSLADQDAFKTVKIQDSTVEVTSKKVILTDGSPLNGVIKVNDKYVNPDVNAMAPGFASDGSKQFQVIGLNGVERRIAELPDWDENSHNVARYFSCLVARPGGDTFAAFYSMGFRKIRYYDLDGNILKEVSVDFPDGSVHTEDGYYMTYSEPFASGNRIVVECSNSYHIQKSGDRTPDRTELQIWDWDGKLVHRLMIPMPFASYTVDFSTGTLYAVSGGDEDEIFYCDISKYL